jgi:hypothetical protein
MFEIALASVRGLWFLANALQRRTAIVARAWSLWIGLLLLCMVAALSVLAASHVLHLALHEGADESGHECAVTWFVKGQVEGVGSEPAMPAVVWQFACGACEPVCLWLTVPVGLRPPSCGPPAAA